VITILSVSASALTTSSMARINSTGTTVRAEIRRPGRIRLSSSGVPSATTLPPFSTTTRSATSAASSTMCVVRRIPVPLRRRSARVCQNARRAETSRPTVGSSRTSRAGSATRPIASWSLCCWPPERADARRPRTSFSPISSIARRAVERSVPARAAAPSTTSLMVRVLGNPTSCWTTPRRRRTPALDGSPPATRTVPDLGLINPTTDRTRVVLPAPLGPSRANISPLLMSRSTVFSAWRPPL
jgi:hypothetical protein